MGVGDPLDPKGPAHETKGWRFGFKMRFGKHGRRLRDLVRWARKKAKR